MTRVADTAVDARLDKSTESTKARLSKGVGRAFRKYEPLPQNLFAVDI